MAFHVGQKVVCVDTTVHDPRYRWIKGEKPIYGAIYTVERLVVVNDEAALHLLEIQRSAVARSIWGPQCGYGAYRFRPVIERKSQTDIGVFLEILDRETIRDPKDTPITINT